MVEVGPQPVLRAPMRQSRPDLKFTCLMAKDMDSADTLQEAMVDLWTSGVPIAWKVRPNEEAAEEAEG